MPESKNNEILFLNVKLPIKTRDYSAGVSFSLCNWFLCVFNETIHLKKVGLLQSPF